MWTDRSLYEPKVLLTSVPKSPVTMAAPTVQAEVEASAELVQSNGEGGARGSGGKKRRLGQGLAAEEDGDEQEEDGELAAQVVHAVADGDQVDGPISDGVVTLSGLPRSRWESLFNLEVVKERNKPAEPPKPPPRAPFFLPTLRGERGVTPAFGEASGAEGAAGAGAGAGAVAGAAAGAEGGGEAAAPMAGWGDAWSDDEEGGEGGDDGWGEDEEGDDSGGGATLVDADAGNGTKSRLLKNSGAMALYRGKLATLVETYDASSSTTSSSSSSTSASATDEAAAIGELLKSLNPSAVDVEIASLCRGAVDEDGELKERRGAKDGRGGWDGRGGRGGVGGFGGMV